MAAATEYPEVLQIRRSNGAMLVKIAADGSIEYGEGYEPDEAARIFWQAIRDEFPGFIMSPDGVMPSSLCPPSAV